MKRSLEKEMMDLRGNSPELLADDLRNLRLLNRYLRGSRSVIMALWRAIGREPLGNFSLLDIGTGSADIPAAILAKAKRCHVAAKIVGIEADPITARIAENLTNRHAEINIIRGDAGAPPFSPGAFDFVVASQFLHHFTETKILDLLRQWAKLARRGIVISDLVRHPLAYHGIRLLTLLTTRNPMTRTDAPLSVHRAFTFNEWRDLLRRADIGPVEMISVFPFRMAATVRIGGRR
ncbi:MAG TPA: methyltransferase domain-containing protein [Candidatus Binatia bacterium]|nr:methyltransferase domain-containing protein [Candidatus Binatia bacterium]